MSSWCLAVYILELNLVRLPDREVKNVPKRRGSWLLPEFNVKVLEHHGLKFREVSVAARDAVAASRIDLVCGAHVRVPDFDVPLGFNNFPSLFGGAMRRQLHLFPRGYVSRHISASTRHVLLGSRKNEFLL
jgi:hypothetical protein